MATIVFREREIQNLPINKGKCRAEKKTNGYRDRAQHLKKGDSHLPLGETGKIQIHKTPWV